MCNVFKIMLEIAPTVNTLIIVVSIAKRIKVLKVKTDCKHKIAVHALEGGKYKIVWHFQHNHAFDPRRITKATRNWLMDLASTNIPRASSDSRRSVTKFKLSSFYFLTNLKFPTRYLIIIKTKIKEPGTS